MTSLSFLMLLFLCVSLHACTARSLSVTKKEPAKYNRFHKELDKVKLLETLTTSNVKDFKQAEKQPQQQKEANNELNTCESCSSVFSLKEMIIRAASGTSFQMDLPSFLVAKGQRRHGRSMLGPVHHHVEETVVANAIDTAEDIVEMDYAQPHRKPPIHNEKP